MALTEYTAQGQASDVQDVSPYSGQAWNQLQNSMSFINQQMGQSGVLNPLAAMQSFGQFAPGLMEMALGATSPYAQAIDRQTQALLPQVTQAALNPFAGSGFYSTGASGAAMEAAGNVGLAALEKKLAAQTGMAGNLLTSGMGLLGQGYGQAGNLLGGMFGQTLGSMAQFGAPEYWQPEYVETNTPWGNLFETLSALTGIGANIGKMAAGF